MVPTQTPTHAAEAPKSLRWRLYRLVRPLVRPLAWRTRIFLMGELHAEVVALRSEVAALRAELRERGAQDAQALEPKILAVIEQALLTLALDREEQRGE